MQGYSYKAAGDFAPTFVSQNIREHLGYEPRYSCSLWSRARETCSGRLVGAAAGGGTTVRSAAAPAAFLFSGLLVADSGRRWSRATR
jgi:hypothetical protein